MNKVILMGRLTRDPEVRYSAGENALITLCLYCKKTEPLLSRWLFICLTTTLCKIRISPERMASGTYDVLS